MTNHMLSIIIFFPLLMAAGVGLLFVFPMQKASRDNAAR